MQRFSTGRRRLQRGQAMVFATATMVVVLLSMLAMYSVGQLTTQKMKLQNTVDAVAYSLAVVQARDFNFAAYMNRAMIANQVAVGQIVSLTGWIRNADDTYNGSYSKIGTTIANLSPMSSMWTAPNNAFGSVARTAKNFMDSAGPAMVMGLDLLIKALGLASWAYHNVGVYDVAIETALKVRDENDGDAAFTTVGSLVAMKNLFMDFRGFAGSFDPNGKDGQDRFAKVVDSSSDLFYKGRTLPLPLRLTPSLIDPARLVTPGLGPLLMLQFHSGGSVMAVNDRKSFVSVDATGMFIILCLTIPILGIPFPIPIPLPPLPLGAGAAVASGSSPPGIEAARQNAVGHRNGLNNDDDDLALVHYGAAYFNPMTVVPYYIKAGQGPGKNMDTRAGLQTYLDVNANKDKSNNPNQVTWADQGKKKTFTNDKAPAIVIEMERDSDSIATTSSSKFNIGGGSGGALHLEDKALNGKLRAIAKAEAYFTRPGGKYLRGSPMPFNPFYRHSYTLIRPWTDTRTEYGSLYSPYWQAHLVPSSIKDQAISIGVQVLGSALGVDL